MKGLLTRTVRRSKKCVNEEMAVLRMVSLHSHFLHFRFVSSSKAVDMMYVGCTLLKI
ncbi:hypothetical protein J14TS5_12900 [Paenibacillus lautus]|nr:hypothetical protein J14TS5_12900 [Paenibacillus lautus]